MQILIEKMKLTNNLLVKLIFTILGPAVGLLLPVSCGIETGKPTLYSPQVISLIKDNVTSNQTAIIANKPGIRPDTYYDEESTFGYDFYYKIYTETDYDKLGVDSIAKYKKIEDAAVGSLKPATQQRLNTLQDNINDSLYSKPVKYYYNDKSLTNEVGLLRHHLEFGANDLHIGDDDIYIEYKVQTPSKDNGYLLKVTVYRRGRDGAVIASANSQQIDLDGKTRYLSDDNCLSMYRRVYYDELTSTASMRIKDFDPDQSFNYRDYTDAAKGQIDKLDEDIPGEVYDSDSKYYYIAYFVAAYGRHIDGGQLEYLYSIPSLMGVAKVDITQIRTNPSSK